ncbi:MAG: ISL3 family transposase [Coprobacillus sp.]|nr:ISL3 family transposase [Coprobacillus sp.]
MDKDSISRLGVNPELFDDRSSEKPAPDKHNSIITLYMRKEPIVHCIYCGSSDIDRRGTKQITIKHSTETEKRIVIFLYVHQYRCNICTHYFPQKNPFIVQGKQHSHDCDLQILNALRDNTNSYSKVAKDFNVSTTYVLNLFDKKVQLNRLSMPHVLSIDEVYIRKLTKTRYCCVLYAPVWQKIVDVLECRKKDFLIDYFARIPLKEKDDVYFVSMDLYSNYRDVIKLCLPMAVICADSFHVIKNLNDSFNRIRIRIMKSFDKGKYDQSGYYWLLKKYWKYLLMNIKDHSKPITVNRTGMTMLPDQLIEHMLSVDNELKIAYNLKEAYREFNLSATIKDAEERLDILILAFKNSKIREYKSFVTILQNWHQEIINSFNVFDGRRISNGNLERKNADIKTLIRVSFGSTNFERTRNRIMFCSNKNAPIKGERK